MASNNPLDPWALPPPLSYRHQDLGQTSSTSAQPGPVSLRPPHLQSQAREPGSPTNRPDIRSLSGSGRGRVILQHLAGIEVSPGSNPGRQPPPASTTHEPPSSEAALYALAEKSFDVRLMLGFDMELPRIDQRHRRLVRPVSSLPLCPASCSSRFSCTSLRVRCPGTYRLA